MNLDRCVFGMTASAFAVLMLVGCGGPPSSAPDRSSAELRCGPGTYEANGDCLPSLAPGTPEDSGVTLDARSDVDAGVDAGGDTNVDLMTACLGTENGLVL